MRLALHMGTLRGHGSAVVGRNVLRAVAAVAPDDSLLAWVPEDWGLSAADLGPRVTLRTTRPGAGRKLIDENVRIRAALRRWRADRLFSLGDTSLPASPVPQLLMVQQAFLAYPRAEWGFRVPRRFGVKVSLMGAYLRAGLSSVHRVTVQTEHMRDRFAARWGFPAERIDVVPSTIQPAAREVAAEPPPTSRGPIHLCYVATGGAHKNHRVLAGMMAGVVSRHADVRCTLTTTPERVPDLVDEARAMRVLDRFDFRGTLPPDEAMRLLRTARVAVIPSKLESFGIPAREAMALGRPVLAADLPWARESLGEAARYAAPNRADTWAAEASALLADPNGAEALGRAARARFEATDRTWEDIARSYLEILRGM